MKMSDDGMSYEFDVDLLTSFDARSPGGGSGGVMSTDDGVSTFRRMLADGSAGGRDVTAPCYVLKRLVRF